MTNADYPDPFWPDMYTWLHNNVGKTMGKAIAEYKRQSSTP